MTKTAAAKKTPVAQASENLATLQSQLDQVAEAKSQLQQLKQLITAGRDELDNVKDAIKLARAQEQSEAVQRQREVESEVRALRAKRDNELAAIETQSDTEAARLRAANNDLIATKNRLETVVADLESTVAQLQWQQQTVIEAHATQLAGLQESIKKTMQTASERDSQLAAKETKLSETTDRLIQLERRITQTEADYQIKLTGFRDKLHLARERLQKVEIMIREYEAGARSIRDADEIRSERLAERERTLHAKQRALQNDQQELASAKRQFKQTQALY